MVKQEFLAAIREPLKAEGYRKKGFYWYKTVNDLVFCLNLQGSQWDKDDYYFQVGAALHKDNHSSMAPVPARISTRPRAAFLLNVSFKTRLENRMVTRMLSLSMGTTTLAGPACRARK